MVVVVVRGGEERKLEMSSSNLSSGSGGWIEIAAAEEEEEEKEEEEEEVVVVVVEGCFDFGMCPLDLSRLEGGVGREDRLLMLACSWLPTDEVFAGCRRDVCSLGVPGSCFIFASGAAAREATEARDKLGPDFGGFIVAAVEFTPFNLFGGPNSSPLLSP